MAGGAGTGGAADTAGTAADGTVIIDSEIGHGARRPSPQRARGAFVRERGLIQRAAMCRARPRDRIPTGRAKEDRHEIGDAKSDYNKADNDKMGLGTKRATIRPTAI